MARKTSTLFFGIAVTVLILSGSSWGQQVATSASSSNCPISTPGVYVRGADGWHHLSQTAPSKMKAKHAFLNSMSYGAVAAPMVVEYADTHAEVHVHGARPLLCVSHMMTANPPLLVRLTAKKKDRELDSGSIRAVPFANDTREGHASVSSIVPTTTVSSERGTILLHPLADLPPGEYAVMFGAQNLAILDFTVLASQ